MLRGCVLIASLAGNKTWAIKRIKYRTDKPTLKPTFLWNISLSFYERVSKRQATVKYHVL